MKFNGTIEDVRVDHRALSVKEMDEMRLSRIKDAELSDVFPHKEAEPFEQELKRLGFQDEKEFYVLVRHVDLSSQEKFNAFKKWKLEDGSKEGLLKLKKGE